MYDDGSARLGRRLVECGYPAIELPEMKHRVQQGVVLGREPTHGYARGVALQFGDIAGKVREHPLYKEALAASDGRSRVTEPRLMNLFLLIAHYFDVLEHHNILEFGTFRGGSALFMSYLLKKLHPEAMLFAFDTFEGMPAVNRRADMHLKGDFVDADVPGLHRLRERHGLERLQIVQGVVQETFPLMAPAGMRFGLAHFDLDIHEPTVHAQNAAWLLMERGGYYVYDDATVSTCLGAMQAVEDLIRTRHVHAEQVYPHFVFRVGLWGA